MDLKLPSHEQLLCRFDALIDGSKSPEEISAWAGTYFLNDEIVIPDGADYIWEALSFLYGCDLQVSEYAHLHCLEDFMAWRTKFLEKSKA